MQARVEQNAGNADEGYIDVIGLKTISEMSDPVINPNDGHIYDRADIQECIRRNNGKDPRDQEKTITAASLVSGRFVKQINDEFSGRLNRMERAIERMEQNHERTLNALHAAHATTVQDIHQAYAIVVEDVRREAREEGDKRVEDFKKENQQMIENLTCLIKVTGKANIELTAKNEKLTAKNTQLTQENKDLKANVRHVNPVWDKYGHKIDCKLHKGSAPEKTEALKAYKEKVTSSLTDKELKEAVNDLGPLKEPKIARRDSFFFPSIGTSTTLKLASKLQKEVSADKGWAPPQPQ